MAEILPVNFAIPGEASVVSYSYSDIADGSGIVNLYATSFSDSTGTYGVLTNQIMPVPNTSSAGNSATISAQGADTKLIDDDKDIVFNVPKILRGKVLVNLAWSAGDSSCSSFEAYAIVRCRKWDGTTETELASVQTTTISGSVNSTYYRSEQMYFTVPTTHFAKGETLRFTIEIWGHLISSTVAANISYRQTPTNVSDGNYNFTYLKFGVPFDIDR